MTVEELLNDSPTLDGISDPSADGFWEYGASDFVDHVLDLGWQRSKARDEVWFVVVDTDGAELTYCEGDLYRGDRL